MTGSWLRPAFSVGLFLSFLAVALQGVQCEELESVPPEDLCRPYIEKALKDFGTGSLEQISAEVEGGEKKHEEETPLVSEETDEIKEEDETKLDDKQDPDKEKSTEATETDVSETTESIEEITEEKSVASEEKVDDESANVSAEEIQEDKSPEEETAEDASEGEIEKEEGKSDETVEIVEGAKDQSDEQADEDSGEKKAEESDVDKNEDDEKSDEKSDENADNAEAISDETKASSAETIDDDKDESVKDNEDKGISDETTEDEKIDSTEDVDIQKTSEETKDEEKSAEDASNVDDLSEETETLNEEEKESKEEIQVEKKDTETSVEDEHKEESVEDEQTKESVEDEQKEESVEDEQKEESVEDEQKKESAEDEQKEESVENDKKEESIEDDEQDENADENKSDVSTKSEDEKVKSSGEKTEEIKSRERRAIGEEKEEETASKEKDEDENNVEESKRSDEIEEPTPEEDLIQEIEVPENLRPREHINQLLKLDEENEDKERAIQKVADIVLRDLKRLYDNAIQPLESLYKYRDLSNRHFGDPEIFSKPLVLFMGPWSGGKSSIINYLLDIEYKPTALRTGGLRECLEEHCKSPNGTDTGAEPSPAYFNILMHGEEEEVLDGTQLAADWTFSGLQKFGQGMLDRLRGLRLNNKLLEKVNIVEIPGILEIRKQVQRLFPFNDACQWFIDRADIIFLVYDPSKLDVGPETEAILDQLKGREYQTRIILNKADHVKPEELMRVQGALIWNISPLMSSAEPPIMYSTSLWSLPYETGAPTRLLYAQERAFLRDLRSAIDKRVEHKIASARRFAVRVRNHAKMVDCYLTTYYNHKTFFGNKKEISDKIIENPQNYHIYEGLSTLTNISRYDLPDPDVYRDFFRLNPLYDFQLLSSTCTYFRGCPINRLDVAIAYDLPELVGKYKKSVEVVIHENETNSPPS